MKPLTVNDELARLAVRKLKGLDKRDVQRAAQAVAKSPPAWLVAGGIAVGVGVGLLLAPESGKQTRARLRRWAGQQRWLGALKHRKIEVTSAD